ncbi:MAG: Hsp20/alpha crystallin family protein [Desulfobacteraceae bacterium]|nr:Hsp20/alpha crystallin family protein [Desulfobacteraceae bacterium]
MTAIKIKVKNDTEDLSDDIRQVIQNFFNVSFPIISSARGWMPAMDVYRTQNALHIVADLSGVDIKSLYLAIKDQFLYLAGQRRPFWNEGEMYFYQMEINYGQFERTIRIPCPIDANKIDASYENGFLVVRLPYQQNKKIKIDIS